MYADLRISPSEAPAVHHQSSAAEKQKQNKTKDNLKEQIRCALEL
jgi:hypothetical protein